VEVTKYEALEELSAEVKLKQLLWDSLEEWDALQAGWMEVQYGTMQGVRYHTHNTVFPTISF
jgi:hypothetical protein